MGEWARVSKSTPCPICERDDWCGITSDGKTARCMRVESESEAVGSDGSCGWVHQLDEPIPHERIPKEKSNGHSMNPEEVITLAKQAYVSERAPFVREMLAADLGVTVDSLERLRVGAWRDEGSGMEYSSWPSRDDKGNIIGISRRYADGSKKTLYGTKNGLFYPMDRDDLSGPILIVEGGSDVAAAISLGIKAIGRPSNIGGTEWIKNMIGDSDAVVVGENDSSEERRGGIPSCPKECSGCGHCFPGLFGARIVSEKINRLFIMPPEGVKDFRQMTSVRESGGWANWFKLFLKASQ